MFLRGFPAKKCDEPELIVAVFHTFDDELLLILDLQVLQCVVLIVQKGEVVLEDKKDSNMTFLLYQQLIKPCEVFHENQYSSPLLYI